MTNHTFTIDYETLEKALADAVRHNLSRNEEILSIDVEIPLNSDGRVEFDAGIVDINSDEQLDFDFNNYGDYDNV